MESNAREFLVTGGTGVLESRVVDGLRGSGHEVRVFSRSGEEVESRGTLRPARDWKQPCEASRRSCTAPRATPEVGGPEVRTFADLARSYFEARGRRKRSVEIPVPGKIARALREGAQTAPDHR